MKPSIIVWDLETVPDLGGFAAANDLVVLTRDHAPRSFASLAVECCAAEPSIFRARCAHQGELGPGPVFPRGRLR
jgi:hypothetical protein